MLCRELPRMRKRGCSNIFAGWCVSWKGLSTRLFRCKKIDHVINRSLLNHVEYHCSVKGSTGRRIFTKKMFKRIYVWIFNVKSLSEMRKSNWGVYKLLTDVKFTRVLLWVFPPLRVHTTLPLFTFHPTLGEMVIPQENVWATLRNKLNVCKMTKSLVIFTCSLPNSVFPHSAPT